MSQTAQRYPLSWPIGWPRTEPRRREAARFRRYVSEVKDETGNMIRGADKRPLTVADALKRLSRELGLLGATDEVLSTNIPMRLDGLPRSGQAEPSDPGAAVYFKMKKRELCLACDKWDRTADNIAAIAQHIDALRRIDRYGIGTLQQAFAGYAALPSGVPNWWDVLEIEPTATLEDAEKAYRRLAQLSHPDVIGGSEGAMARLNAAREAAREALG